SMTNVSISFFFGLACLFLLSYCTHNQEHVEEERKISVFAAASLANVLEEIIDTFESTQEGKVKVNYASSGTLARQIEQGASADLFISANREWFDFLNEQGYFKTEDKGLIAKNQLVLICPRSAFQGRKELLQSSDFSKILGPGRLALGDPAHVPAGRYAKAALEYFDAYTDLKSAMIPTKDVRSALHLVELEEASLGIVYQTDARQSQKVKVLTVFPSNCHPSIEYLAATLNKKSTSKRFWAFLHSEKSKTIWKKYGFQD
ncbi:MAG: molybdate ABC transporter substrate-binding protein, partial [Bacteroidota bacterium]